MEKYFEEMKEAFGGCCHSTPNQEGKCADGADESAMSCKTAMMDKCKHFALVPLVLGVVLLLFGLFLSPAVIVALWMIAASLILIIGVLGLVMTRNLTGGCC
jgi:hypothetical protein